MQDRPNSGRHVGNAVPRREDARLLTGRACYVDDLHPPGLAHMAFVRSPHAHARVKGIRLADGVPAPLLLLTAADIRDRTRPMPIMVNEGVEHVDAPYPLLADGEVRFVGQPVAAVVAESRALAEDVAELVEVDYEPLEPVVEPRSSDLELMRWHRTAGDVEGAFASADVVARGTFAMPRLVAAPMEPRGAVASYDRDGDMLTAWVSAQDSHRPLSEIAHVLCRPEERVHVIVPDVGGAFGSKGVLAPEIGLVCVAAMDLGRPVKWAEDRLENFLLGYQGRGMEADVEIALSSDGTMLGLRARIRADLGAYLLTTTAIPVYTASMLMCGCYTFPAADVEAIGVRTNKVPTGPYRGAGRPEAAYFLESAVDVAARELGMDPVELRRRNLIEEFPYPTLLGFTYDSGDYRQCLDRALELAEPAAPAGDDVLVGTGVCVYVERAGGLWETARAVLEPSGRLIVRPGSSAHGQGHDTTFAQIAAERMHMELADVALQAGDSGVVARGVGTFASRSVVMGGSALRQALDAIGESCVRVAAGMLGVPDADVAWDERGFSAGGRTVSLAEVAAASGGLEAESRFESAEVFSSGAYVAVVEIEKATGRLKLRQIVAIDDAGTIINPLLAEGQVIGATVQGLGQCLVEEATWDEQGQPTSASFADYSLLTAAEIPPIASDFVETPSPLNPLGAKGVGEGGAVGVPPAVANAIADALGGRRVDPPFTEEKIWRALQDRA